MKTGLKTVCATLLSAAIAAGTVGPSAAFTLPAAPMLSEAANVLPVQYRERGRDFWRQGDGAYWKGYRGHRERRPGHRQFNGFWFPLAAFGLGAIVGGAIANNPGPGPGYYGGGNVSAHVAWCYNRYRSYRDWDNTFQPYNGPRRQCLSPYG